MNPDMALVLTALFCLFITVLALYYVALKDDKEQNPPT